MNKVKYTIILALIALLASCQKESSYKYEVTGTSGDYSVTLENSDNNTQQWSNVSNGWYYTWNQTGERWLYISAQNNKGSGDVTVKIIKDGKVLVSNTGYGAYSIATVSGNY
jgi:major membrane immunogen (membrane-anchored lipoprotein)